MEIRAATPADAEAIGGVHVDSWRHTYEGLMPPEVLNRLDEERWGRAWRRRLARRGPADRTWVAEENGTVVGFIDTGRSRDPDVPEGTFEVYAVYLAPNHTGRGIGRSLVDHALADLQSRGVETITLWVLETNERARSFYVKTGWIEDGTVKAESVFGLWDAPAVRYRYAPEVGNRKHAY